VHFYYFLQKIIADAPFRDETSGSQFWSALDFDDGNGKSFTRHSTHGVDLRPQYEVLKVRELPLSIRE